jgi:hypothetical protein
MTLIKWMLNTFLIKKSIKSIESNTSETDVEIVVSSDWIQLYVRWNEII